MRNNRRLLAESLEEEENLNPEVEVSEINAEIDNIVGSVQDIEEQEQVVEGAIEEIDLAEEELDKLDAIEEQLEENKEAQMSEGEFESKALVVESIMNRYGPGFKTLATESFGTDNARNREILSDRVAQTKLATENFVTDAAYAVSDYMIGLAKSNKSLVGSLEKTAGRVDRLMNAKGGYIELKADTTKGHSFTNNQFVRRLTINGKFLGDDLNALTTHLRANLKLKLSDHLSDDILAELKKAGEDGKLSEDISYEELTKALPKLAKLSDAAFEDFKSIGLDGHELATFGDEFWSITKVKEITGKSPLRLLIGAALWGYLLGIFAVPVVLYRTNKKLLKNSADVNVIPVNKMTSYGKFLTEAAKDIERSDYYKMVERYAAAKALESDTKAIEKEVDGLHTTRKTKRQIKRVVRGQGKLAREVLKHRNRNITLIATGTIGYVKASLNKYKFK